MIRYAAPSDFEQLFHLARRFVDECGLPITFSEERTRQTLWAAIQAPSVSFLVDANNHGLICGAAIVTYESEWSNETLAYVTKFFVEPELRGMDTGRALAQACEHEAWRNGAVAIFAAATADMGDTVEKLYVRLWTKRDFRVLGRFVMKELKHG